ncbi:MAG: putative transporter [Planctomycetota bacterium]
MPPVANAILVLASIAMSGLLLGSVRIRGIGLGAAGVLFTGILFGHLGSSIDPEIAHFAKEFGLVLFVFAIGLQLGPGIIQLWKQQGLILNVLAAAVVLQGTGIVIAAHWLLDWSVLEAAGLFSGSTTNTPSLGAAQQAASALESTQDLPMQTLASAYAVAYPGGILGIIGSMLWVRRIFRIDVDREAQSLAERDPTARESIQTLCIEIDNQHIEATPFGKLPGVEETGVRVSRMRRQGERDVDVATDEVRLKVGDRIQVVGTPTGIARFVPMIGRPVDEDLTTAGGRVEMRRVVVTNPAMVSQPLHRMALDRVDQVTVTRIRRAGVEMPARGSSQFTYGDIVTIVGEPESLDGVASKLGNQVKKLDETQFAPLFLGIAVGVLLGMVPLPIPGVPFPVRLGLAGGPLIAAIVFSLVGRIGRFVWYIPHSANLALREMGIILFLASAGLSAGKTFFAVALTGQGLIWMGVGMLVTTIPLITTACFARVVLKMNYLTICGVVAGSMTDPPALAFANSLSDSPAGSTAYAAVYPLTMVLRIVAAQSLIYLLA